MKVNDYSLAFLPLEAIDALDDIKTILNYGKYQYPVVTTIPSWVGRQGESALFIASGTIRLYVCTSDQSSANWFAIAGNM